MIQVARYDPSHKGAWNHFIAGSKNGVFLFYRDYMEYHSNRFTDHSLLFFVGSRLIAVMPANVQDDTLESHGGLTFGGVVSDRNMKTPLMLEVFDALINFLRGPGMKRVVYKAIPHIYHRIPAEEDLYALFVHDARLVRRDASSTIPLSGGPGFNKGRQGCVKRAREKGLEVKHSYDFSTFMAIDEQHLLKKHRRRPVHTRDEMQMLARRFPENIRLFTAHKGEMVLGGVIVYESDQVAHAQYVAATDEGKETGALDAVMDFLINDYYRAKKIFDFGISTDREGRYLDVGLVSNKEGFGARTTVYDFYELDLAR